LFELDIGKGCLELIEFLITLTISMQVSVFKAMEVMAIITCKLLLEYSSSIFIMQAWLSSNTYKY
jgi:hypothetical protein